MKKINKKIAFFFSLLLVPFLKAQAQFKAPAYGMPPVSPYQLGMNVAGWIIYLILIPAIFVIGIILLVVKWKIKKIGKVAADQEKEEKISKLKKSVRRLLIVAIGLLIFIVGFIAFKVLMNSFLLSSRYGPSF